MGIFIGNIYVVCDKLSGYTLYAESTATATAATTYTSKIFSVKIAVDMHADSLF